MGAYLKYLISALVIIGVLVAINAMLSESGLFGFGLDNYNGRIIVFIAINIILAVSLNLINGVTGQFSIGHAGFMAVGAYMSAYITVYYGRALEGWLIGHSFGLIGETGANTLVFLLVILVGAMAAAIAGLLVGIPSLRLKGDYLAIVTLGFAEIIRIVIVNIDVVGGPTGLTVPGYGNFLWIGLFAVITIVVVHNMVHSDMGRALVSIREDELAAEAMGINTTRYKVLAFVVSSAFAGIAGVLFAHYNKNLSTQEFQFIRSFEIIIMIVLGGMGSITGAILGAVVITILPEALRKLPDISYGTRTFKLVDLRLVIYSAVLIVVMLTRPQGLLGTRELSLNWLKRKPKKEILS